MYKNLAKSDYVKYIHLLTHFEVIYLNLQKIKTSPDFKVAPPLICYRATTTAMISITISTSAFYKELNIQKFQK